MNSFEVYSTYVALKTHFSRKTYDYFKYQGAVRVSEKTYSKGSNKYFIKTFPNTNKKEQVIEYLCQFFGNSTFISFK